MKMFRLGEMLVAYYAITVSIITINLYIGLLSELYATIAASASSKAYLEEAKVGGFWRPMVKA